MDVGMNVSGKVPCYSNKEGHMGASETKQNCVGFAASEVAAASNKETMSWTGILSQLVLTYLAEKAKHPQDILGGDINL